jgi:hypothetical protein
LVLADKAQANSAVDEECAETVENPVEALHEANAGYDEDAAHEQRAEDSPEQHAVLVLVRDSEEAEDYEEKKKIVDAQREFDEISGNELNCDLPSLPEENQNGKCHGQGKPHGAANEGITRAPGASALEGKEIQRECGEREDVEEDPRIEQWAYMLNQNAGLLKGA